jgi:hypothetical protein
LKAAASVDPSAHESPRTRRMPNTGRRESWSAATHIIVKARIRAGLRKKS